MNCSVIVENTIGIRIYIVFFIMIARRYKKEYIILF